MKVLLLHAQDVFPQRGPRNCWDLVVDLGRAPQVVYDRWSRQAGCRVLSLYEFADEIQDLRHLRQLLQLGVGSVVDGWGIDWWDVLSLEIVPQIQQLMLVQRLAKELGANCELYSSRPNPLAAALQTFLNARLTILESRTESGIRKMRKYCDVFSQLSGGQFFQALEDKFDGDHSIRRRFSQRTPNFGSPVIVLPSAYVNVSRTALSYAALLPDQKFLLVLARSNGRVRSLPTNVRVASLAPYFVSTDKPKIAFLRKSWESLRKRLVLSAQPFAMADAAGLLGRISSLLPWGIALRDAWHQFFESENVTACLSADDSNPPSRIPLIIARQRGLPALACHHGALDYQMAIKTNHADFYLAKSEMEQDYLKRVCQLAPEEMVVAAPASSNQLPLPPSARRFAPWLVFFTEPYQNFGWRSEEVYRDILPRVWSLAENMGLKLVFKLHPFESIKGHRKMLCRLIPEREGQIGVVAGPPTSELWNKIRLALTVQSSTALECAASGIPVFLCSWLRDSYSGYVSQYTRFGVGQVLQSPEQIGEIPRLLEAQGQSFFQMGVSRIAGEREQLANLFSGVCSLPLASNG